MALQFESLELIDELIDHFESRKFNFFEYLPNDIIQYILLQYLRYKDEINLLSSS